MVGLKGSALLGPRVWAVIEHFSTLYAPSKDSTKVYTDMDLWVQVRRFVLAGGRSRRFGTDKARACINGQPLVQRIADHLLPEAKGVCVVADRADKYADLGLATLADPFPPGAPSTGW